MLAVLDGLQHFVDMVLQAAHSFGVLLGESIIPLAAWAEQKILPSLEETYNGSDESFFIDPHLGKGDRFDPKENTECCTKSETTGYSQQI